MEPLNSQNNNDDSIKIHPNASGGANTVQNFTVHTFADDMKNAGGQINASPTEIKAEPKVVIHPEDKVVMQTLHTYADDVRNAVQNDGVSMAQIVMAEAKKQEAEKRVEEELSPSSPKNKSIILLSVVMVLLAGVSIAGVWYYVANRDKNKTSVEGLHKQTIIPYDKEFAVELDSRERNKLVGGILSSKKQVYEKDVSIVYIPISVKNVSSTTPVSLEMFFSILETRAPSALIRALDGGFMVGLDRSFGGESPFVVFYSDSFSQIYAGMLEWEPAIADDIGDIFFSREDLVEPAASVSTTSTAEIVSNIESTSTIVGTTSNITATAPFSTTTNTVASTTPLIMTENEQKEFKSRYIIANSLKFKDEVLTNRDMRVLRTTSGKVLMYYTFINDKVLLIAKDFRTLDEIVKRLATSQFKQ